MNNLEFITTSDLGQKTNDDTEFKRNFVSSSNISDSKEKTDQSRKKPNKISQKKRNTKNKKKKKLLKVTEYEQGNNNESSFNTKRDINNNPYRKFLLYKLRKKYEAKIYIYDIKKVNELIFNIPSHFTATFKEYLLKEEEAEFLKRIYHKTELHKKLKNIFYFYEKYSKIFPNYIVIPEGHYLYKNILKKQKMIDKLQRIKEEESKNKKQLLEVSFNTIFTNGAIDSIYSNNVDPLNNINLANIISMDNIGKNEDQEVIQIQNIIKNIENNEKFTEIKNTESLTKKQIIYKKEFKGLRSLSKSTNFQNGRETRRKSKEYDRNKTIIAEKDYQKSEAQTRTDIRKKKNNIYNIKKSGVGKKNFTGKSSKILSRVSEDLKNSIESESSESEEESEKERDEQDQHEEFINMKIRKNMINDYIKNSKEMNNNKTLRNKYKRLKQNRERNKNKDYKKDKINEEEEEEEEEIVMKNKRKKFVVLRGNRHYFIKNTDNNDKSLEKAYTNDDKNLTYKSKNELEQRETTFLYPRMKDKKNNISYSQNKNLSKDYTSRHNQNFILYKKKVCNGSRGLSISKKNSEYDNNNSNSKRLHRINTNFTTNGSKIVPLRKYVINDQKNITIKNPGNNDLLQDGWKKIMNNNVFINDRHNNNNNQNHYKTITYNINYNNNTNEDINKDNDYINGNIYYKKNKIDNLRNSHGDKSCPKNYNKFLVDIEINKRKKYENNNDSIEDRSNEQSNAEPDNTNHRYYRTSQRNSKKFKLRAPKNFYKIDFV